MQLQELAAAVPAPDVAVEQPILLPVPFQCVLHVLVIAQPIALDDVQLVAIGRAEQVDHGILAIGLDGDGVDHKRVALIMADGISVPGGLRRRRMGLEAAPCVSVVPAPESVCPAAGMAIAATTATVERKSRCRYIGHLPFTSIPMRAYRESSRIGTSWKQRYRQ
jgi:hypothetical protein